MSSSDSVPPDSSTRDLAGRAFLTILPIVRGIACNHFRDVCCPARRDDLVAEVIGLAFTWCRRLVACGRDPTAFPVALARLAVRAAACGRRVAGQERVNDVLSAACRRRHGFKVEPLPAGSPDVAPEIADALTGHTKAPVPAQVQFRVDFGDWLGGLSEARRRITCRLAAGHRTQDVAAEFSLTPARISQMRTELRDNYLSFLTGRPRR
jgi:hypothetical protein